MIGKKYLGFMRTICLIQSSAVCLELATSSISNIPKSMIKFNNCTNKANFKNISINQISNLHTVSIILWTSLKWGTISSTLTITDLPQLSNAKGTQFCYNLQILQTCAGSNRNLKFYKPTKTLTLIDWSPNMASIGMTKTVPASDYKYIVGDVTKMPFKDD